MTSGNPPLRLGVVGCGRVAEHCHLPVVRALAGVAVAALVDSDAARVNALADRFGVQRRYTDHRAMLDAGGVDVVAVCTPPHLHAEIGLAALDAGTHLFMEKPLALSLDDADQLVARAAAARVKAFAAFNLRWHRLLRQARTAIERGLLGPLEVMHTVFTSKAGFLAQGTDWRSRHDLGGNVLFDLGIHHFDLWRWLSRSEIETIFAEYRTDEAARDRATLTATMRSGVLVTAAFSRGLSDTNELDVYGRNGRLRASCYRFDGLHVTPNSVPPGAPQRWLKGVVRIARNAPQAVRGFREGGDVLASYRAEWRHFIAAIRADAPVDCTFDDGRRALQVALAALESAARGQPVAVARATGAIAPPAPVMDASRQLA